MLFLNNFLASIYCSLALFTALFFVILWTVLSESCPTIFVKFFMKSNDEILKIAPFIIRIYAISFTLLPFNIFLTYYFQAIIKPTAAFLISVGRALAISGISILILSLTESPNLLLFAMPITELLVGIYGVILAVKYTKKLPGEIC